MNCRYSWPSSTFFDAAGGIRTHTDAVLETAASAVGLPRPVAAAAAAECSEHDSNLHHRDSRSRASAELGYQSGRSLQWTPEGIEPSLAGCKPVVFPLDDGPISTFMLREGVEPSASAFGGPRSDPIELPQREWSRQDSNLH